MESKEFICKVQFKIVNKKTGEQKLKEIYKTHNLAVSQPFAVSLKWSVANNPFSHQDNKRKNQGTEAASTIFLPLH